MRPRSILMPVTAMLLSLALLEGMLWIAAIASPRIALLLSPGIPKELPDPVLGERPNPGLPDHDARGFRNPVALEQADIVVLGDSQTYGSEVSRDNAWPTSLARVLGVPTYNMSLGGWGAGQYYLLAGDALALKPRVLIVAIYAGNDLADAYDFTMRTHVDALLADSPHDRSYYEAIDAERGPVSRYWIETRDRRRGAFRTWSDAWVEPLGAHGKIFGLIRGLFRSASATEANMKTDAVRDDFEEYATKIAHLPRDFYFPFRTGAVGTVFTPVARRSVADRRDPRIEEGLRITLAAIDHLHSRCTDACDLVVVEIPSKEYAFSEAVANSGVEAPPAYLDLVRGESALWLYVQRELENRGISYADARVPLARAIRENRNPYLADWDGHPNAFGNALIAEYVAKASSLQAVKH